MIEALLIFPVSRSKMAAEAILNSVFGGLTRNVDYHAIFGVNEFFS